MNYEVLKLASQIGTYTGLSASSLLTWINLHFKTGQDPDAGHRKVLTPAGKVYRALLVLSFAITIASAILQNVADAKLRKSAEEHGNQAIQQALEKQHQQYVKDLKKGETGPMEPYTIPFLPVSLTPNPVGVTQYRIRMEAKNGVFVQCLDVRPERNPETHQGFWNSKSVIWLRNIAIISQNDWPKIGK